MKNLETNALPLQAPVPSAKLAQLVLLGEDHSGRDEMNLAGHPFALLQQPAKCLSNEPIFYEWPRTLPNEKKVTASWHVEPGAQSGMPGPNEELLYLLMLQMTREAAEHAGAPGDWPQVVHFSRGDLLERLSWNDGPRGCSTLETAFTRLNAVSIKARWAFYDARAKSPMEQVNFHILSGVGITPEPRGRKQSGALPLSWWKWDDVVYTSLLAGNVRSLALDFTLSLSSPTARRLFRLLELLRHMEKTPRPMVTMGAFKLRDRLGMTAYKHVSKVKEKLLAGIEELQATGYLGEVEWQKARDGSPMAVFAFGRPQMAQVVPKALKGPQIASNGPRTASAGEVTGAESKQQFAQRMKARFDELPDETRTRLLETARANVAPIFWDRLELPDSPMSLELWELVEREQ